MKRRLLTGLLAVVVCSVIAMQLLDHLVSKPMYEPGMVRNAQNLSGPLDPPPQPDDNDYWHVEKDVRLLFQAHGTGRPVLVVHGGPGFPDDEPWKGLEPLTVDHTFYYYHQRGCGKSTRSFDRFESKNYYANMTEFERSLGIGAQLADMEQLCDW